MFSLKVKAHIVQVCTSAFSHIFIRVLGLCTSSAAKKKSMRYCVEYLEYGFIPAPHDHLLPLCLICKATFSNENMKPCKMKKHLISLRPEKKDKHN
ncbi:hypothetical protein M513_00707 [Trichuris suis]|uniref:BED-type domain-containing protein n=1 Tax=Trichuris suis TaxID=68888 RepID=A0A085MMN5_9BILA|nr:hypothetical protein M513_00707 [Trichuris suis]